MSYILGVKKKNVATLYAWPCRSSDPIIKPSDYWQNPDSGYLYPVYERSECTEYFLSPLKLPIIKGPDESHDLPPQEDITNYEDAENMVNSLLNLPCEPDYPDGLPPIPEVQPKDCQEPPEDHLVINQTTTTEDTFAIIYGPASKIRKPRSTLPVVNKGKDFVMCTFCKSNGESPEVFQTHRTLSNDRKVTCPVLRKFVCPDCNATGDDAHTLKYCPLRTPMEQFWDKNMFPRLVYTSIGKVKVCRY